MALDFPSSPTLYQIFNTGESSFIWNGKQWVGYSTSLIANYNASSIVLESDGNPVGATTTLNFDSGFSILYNSGITTISGPSLVGYATEGYVNDSIISNQNWVSTDVGIHTLSNVGIGTTNPTSALTVSGDAIVTGVVTASSFSGSGSGLTGVLKNLVEDTSPQLGGTLDLNAKNVNGIGTIFVQGTVGGTYGLRTGDNGTGNHDALKVRWGPGRSEDFRIRTITNLINNNIYNPTTPGIEFATSYADTNIYVRQYDGPNFTSVTRELTLLNSSGNTIINNSLGIGTTNPTSKLTVSGGANISGTTFTNQLSVGTGSSIIHTNEYGVGIGTTADIPPNPIGGEDNKLLVYGRIRSFGPYAAGEGTINGISVGSDRETIKGLFLYDDGTTPGGVETKGVKITAINESLNLQAGVGANYNNVLINNNGVGIGTTNPVDGYNLTLGAPNTGIRTTSLKVYGYADINGLTVKGNSRDYIDNVIITQNPSATFYGNRNVAIGDQSFTTPGAAGENVAIGYYALNVVGNNDGLNTWNGNTAVGAFAGQSVTTTLRNTFIGNGSGRYITTGGENTILGSYDGNQKGLDIRTSSNNVVLSDGAGNIRFIANAVGNVGLGTTNPQYKLDVGGDINFTGTLYQNGSPFSGGGGGLSGIDVRDEGSSVGIATAINFGTGLSVSTVSAGIATVTSIPTNNFYDGGIVTGNITLTSANKNQLIAVSTGSSITINLPAGSGLSPGDGFTIVDVGSSETSSGNAATYNITVNTDGSDRILGGSGPLVIDENGASVKLVWMGSTYDWRIV